MSASMTANARWTLFSNCEMWLVSRHIFLLVVVSTADACPVRFLFSILVNCVRAHVLLDGGVLARCVLDLVFGAGAVVLITGFFGCIVLFYDFMFGYR